MKNFNSQDFLKHMSNQDGQPMGFHRREAVRLTGQPAKKQIPPPGRPMPFEEALETTLRENHELLRRLVD